MFRWWMPLFFNMLAMIPLPSAAFDYSDADGLSARLSVPGVSAMAVRDDCLYVASAGSLRVYDIGVTGDPVLAATCSTPSAFINAMSIDGEYLFLQSSSQTLLVDLSLPKAPSVLAAVNGTGSLALYGSRLLVGTEATPRVYDLSNPGSPVELARLGVQGILLGKIGNDILTFSHRSLGDSWNYEVRLTRRTLTGSYALGDSALVYSFHHSYAWSYSPRALQKVADRVRLQLHCTYTDYDGGGCRLGPCVSHSTLELDFADNTPERVSGAQSITMTRPAGFLAATNLYDFTIVNPDMCRYEYLRGLPRAGAPAGTPQLALRSCASGVACAAGSRLFVADAGAVRVYDFSGRGLADTTRVHTYAPRTSMVRPSRAGSRVAWIEEAHTCVEYPGPEYYDYFDEVSRYLNVADLDGGIRLRYRPLLAGPHATTFMTATLCDATRYVVAWAGRTFPSLGNWSLRFQSLDEASPYATVADIGAEDLLTVGSSLLAASGQTLSIVDLSDPQAPVPHGQLFLPQAVSRLFPWDGGAAVAGSSSGLTLVQQAGPGVWQSVATIPSLARVSAIESRDSQLAVAAGDWIHFYDVATPNAPVAVDSLQTMAPVAGFATSGPFVYVGCEDAGLLVYERSVVGPPRYLGGYPLDMVEDVRVENGRLLVGVSAGLITLPLQDGDPLPAYAPDLIAAVDDRGETLLEWRSAAGLGLSTRLFREYDGERLGITFETAGDRCLATDGQTVGLTGATYVLMASADGSAWYEADRAEVDLRASTSALLPAWPNPFNPATNIRYRLAVAGPVRLTIHDLAGRRVRLLVDRPEGAGTRETNWDGRDDAGRVVAAGTYLMRLEAGDQACTGKIAMVR